eukprot:2332189-Pyramimonas_sp.AAC.1
MRLVGGWKKIQDSLLACPEHRAVDGGREVNPLREIEGIMIGCPHALSRRVSHARSRLESGPAQSRTPC